MRPVVWDSRQLTFPDLMVRRLPGLIDNGSMVVSRIEHSQSPDTRGTSGNEHERAIHQA